MTTTDPHIVTHIPHLNFHNDTNSAQEHQKGLTCLLGQELEMCLKCLKPSVYFFSHSFYILLTNSLDIYLFMTTTGQQGQGAPKGPKRCVNDASLGPGA